MIRQLALMHFWEVALSAAVVRDLRPDADRIHPFLTSIIVFFGMIETYRLTHALDLTKIACMVRRWGKSAPSPEGPAAFGRQPIPEFVGRAVEFSCRRLRPVRTVSLVTSSSERRVR